MWTDWSVSIITTTSTSSQGESHGSPRMPSPLRARSLCFAAGLACLAACLLGCARGGHEAPQGGSTTSPAKAKLKRNVELAQVKQEKMTSSVETVGYLDAEGQTDVAAGVSGIVEEVLFREGD